MTANHEALYNKKLCSPDEAVVSVKTGENIAMGMALGEPPALLRALSQRLDVGELSGLKIWYFHSMPEAAANNPEI